MTQTSQVKPFLSSPITSPLAKTCIPGNITQALEQHTLPIQLEGVTTKPQFEEFFEALMGESLQAFSSDVKAALAANPVAASLLDDKRFNAMFECSIDEIATNIVFYGMLRLDRDEREAFDTARAQKDTSTVERYLQRSDVNRTPGFVRASVEAESLVIEASHCGGWCSLPTQWNEAREPDAISPAFSGQIGGLGGWILSSLFDKCAIDPSTGTLRLERSYASES